MKTLIIMALAAMTGISPVVKPVEGEPTRYTTLRECALDNDEDVDIEVRCDLEDWMDYMLVQDLLDYEWSNEFSYDDVESEFYITNEWEFDGNDGSLIKGLDIVYKNEKVTFSYRIDNTEMTTSQWHHAK